MGVLSELAYIPSQAARAVADVARSLAHPQPEPPRDRLPQWSPPTESGKTCTTFTSALRACLAAMEPAHGERENCGTAAPCPWGGEAAMEPAHGERENPAPPCGGSGTSSRPQWSPPTESGKTRISAATPRG
jgi:hypothetical protein